MKLDFTIQDAKERVKYVENILQDPNINPTPSLLEKLADYIIFAQHKRSTKNFII